MTHSPDHLVTALAERYRIERELGQGGMATVYLAEDLRHGRQVAIKVLHPELAAVLGPDRFLAEIKLTAALQHPHILPLFDSGRAGALLYYVMPFVEGETLRTRLARERQLPLGDALRIAREAADALEYAHGRGVVHRDIKPENILLRDGHALVADFGIALAVQEAGGERMTQTGLSLGTPQYMAPEQAMGERDVDRRADVYALGVVTYEMIAGEPPFTGPNSQAIVSRVLTEDARPLSGLRRNVSPQVEEAVATALEKLPADRFPTAAAFAAALVAGGDAGPLRARARRAPRSRRAVALTAAGAVVTVGVLLAAGYAAGQRGGGRAEPATPSRLAILSPTVGGTGVASQFRQIALTPDGDAVVFVGLNGQNQNALTYQRLDAAEPVLVAGGMGLLSPRVTPDGNSILGWSAGLSSVEQERGARLPIGGGSVVDLGREVLPAFGDWTPDGTFWFSQANLGGISRMAPDGSVTPGALAGKSGLGLQQILSDGRTALVVHAPVGTASGPLRLMDLEDGEERPLLEIATVEARIAVGYLLTVRPDGSMWAAPFDESDARITGPPVQIADQVSVTGTQVAQWAVAANGTIAYIPEEPRSLMLVRRDGAARLATSERRNFHSPRFSPDGRRVAVDFNSNDGRDVWVLSLAQRTLTRATFTRDGHDGIWTPDGSAITFTSFYSDGRLGVLQVRPGSGVAAESLLVSDKVAYTGVWTPDAGALVTVAAGLEPGSGIDLAVVEESGRGAVRPLIVNGFDTQYPALSPDGRWLAFVSDQSGTLQVYVRPLHGQGVEVQVSQDGGTEPMWSRDGSELFYVGTGRGGTEMVAAAVRIAPGFEVTGRTTLFDMSEMVGANPHANYDVSPDGRTFVMVQRNQANRIVVLQNLRELVRRLGASQGA